MNRSYHTDYSSYQSRSPSAFRPQLPLKKKKVVCPSHREHSLCRMTSCRSRRTRYRTLPPFPACWMCNNHVSLSGHPTREVLGRLMSIEAPITAQPIQHSNPANKSVLNDHLPNVLLFLSDAKSAFARIQIRCPNDIIPAT